VSPAPASHASPPARPPTPRPARPPAQHVAETRYRDSSRPPVRNRLTYGWGYGVRESRARPSFPVSIRHTRDVIGIRVKQRRPTICWVTTSEWLGQQVLHLIQNVPFPGKIVSMSSGWIKTQLIPMAEVKLRPGRSVQLEDSQSWKLCMRQKLVESMVHSEISSKFSERCLSETRKT